MKLNAEFLRYLTKEEMRVLTAVEMGMKNHEVVPVVLIARIANLKRVGIHKTLQMLLQHKLLARDSSKYEGYKLTFLGLDMLALKALTRRDSVVSVGQRIGVGKESDIHVCCLGDGSPGCLKLHRLGRISFRSVKNNRDYLQHRCSASWLFLSRLAAQKEFTFMRALHEHNFPVPKPVDANRHVIVMSLIDAFPLSQVRELRHPFAVAEELISWIVKFAQCGFIHSDFNEFNLMIDDEENITIIDFPQIVAVTHPNAESLFARDVNCIKVYFKKRYGVELTGLPALFDAIDRTEMMAENGKFEQVNPLLPQEDDILSSALHNQKEDDNTDTEDDDDNNINDDDCDSQSSSTSSHSSNCKKSALDRVSTDQICIVKAKRKKRMRRKRRDGKTRVNAGNIGQRRAETAKAKSELKTTEYYD